MTKYTRHYLVLAIFFGIISIGMSLTAKIFAQTSTTTTTDTTTACSYHTGEWSSCSSSGKQTRTVTAYPSGCVDNSSSKPASVRTCDYVAPQETTTCSYHTGEWSSCSSSGKQTRTVTAYPSGCVDNSSSKPASVRTCDYVDTSTKVTACSYTYSAWSSCNSSGKQTRTIASKNPSGCVDTADPILEQSCTYANISSNSSVTCSYNLSDWSTCNTSTNKQTRTIISRTPAGCYDSEVPKLQKICEPTSSTASTSTTAASNTAASTSIVDSSQTVTPYFNFLNLNGGEVINGTIKIQGTVKNATSVEFYLIPSESNNPKYLGQAKKTQENVWELSFDSTSQPNGSFHIRPKIKNAYGSYDAGQRMLIILNQDQEDQKMVNSQDPENKNSASSDRTSEEWQNEYFKSNSCIDDKICGGNSDPDKDGLTNNEEYRYGTNPTNPDTDKDSFLDGDEIKNGFNPLKASPGDKSDKIIFENPKESGEIKKDIYKVNGVELVYNNENGNKNVKLTGKALPNTFVTIYIYSDPIVLTVKTDSDGNWSYILDKDLEDGNHEVYVAITDNTGKITTKSEPLAFIKTAEAVSIIPPAEASDQNKIGSPTEAKYKKDIFLYVALIFGGLALALAIIGLHLHILHRRKSEELIN